MRSTVPLITILAIYFYILPQFNVPVDTTALLLALPAFFIMIFSIYIFHLRMVIMDPDKEEMEIHTQGLLKVFVSKHTAILILLIIILTSCLLIVEVTTKVDEGITIGRVHYSMDKIMITVMISLLFLVLEETYETHMKSMKRIKIKKKNK